MRNSSQVGLVQYGIFLSIIAGLVNFSLTRPAFAENVADPAERKTPTPTPTPTPSPKPSPSASPSPTPPPCCKCFAAGKDQADLEASQAQCAEQMKTAGCAAGSQTISAPPGAGSFQSCMKADPDAGNFPPNCNGRNVFYAGHGWTTSTVPQCNLVCQMLADAWNDGQMNPNIGFVSYGCNRQTPQMAQACQSYLQNICNQAAQCFASSNPGSNPTGTINYASNQCEVGWGKDGNGNPTDTGGVNITIQVPPNCPATPPPVTPMTNSTNAVGTPVPSVWDPSDVPTTCAISPAMTQ